MDFPVVMLLRPRSDSTAHRRNSCHLTRRPMERTCLDAMRFPRRQQREVSCPYRRQHCGTQNFPRIPSSLMDMANGHRLFSPMMDFWLSDVIQSLSLQNQQRSDCPKTAPKSSSSTPACGATGVKLWVETVELPTGFTLRNLDDIDVSESKVQVKLKKPSMDANGPYTMKAIRSVTLPTDIVQSSVKVILIRPNKVKVVAMQRVSASEDKTEDILQKQREDAPKENNVECKPREIHQHASGAPQMEHPIESEASKKVAYPVDGKCCSNSPCTPCCETTEEMTVELNAGDGDSDTDIKPDVLAEVDIIVESADEDVTCTTGWSKDKCCPLGAEAGNDSNYEEPTSAAMDVQEMVACNSDWANEDGRGNARKDTNPGSSTDISDSINDTFDSLDKSSKSSSSEDVSTATTAVKTDTDKVNNQICDVDDDETNSTDHEFRQLVTVQPFHVKDVTLRLSGSQLFIDAVSTDEDDGNEMRFEMHKSVTIPDVVDLDQLRSKETKSGDVLILAPYRTTNTSGERTLNIEQC